MFVSCNIPENHWDCQSRFFLYHYYYYYFLELVMNHDAAKCKINCYTSNFHMHIFTLQWHSPAMKHKKTVANIFQ